MVAVQELAPVVGKAVACDVLGVWRGAPAREEARVQRDAVFGPPAPRPALPRPPLALTSCEQEAVLGALNDERFLDIAPAAVYAMLLDDGVYLSSPRTMYRLLAANGACRERRNQRRHGVYSKPELLATKPNQVWSWDITKLKGPWKGIVFHLYVILDIFSRRVVGWMVAGCESQHLAEQLIGETVARHDVVPGTLTLHADRGSSMRSKLVADLLLDLAVIKSHSRPYVSDDNPYSESQFKTMKYRPDFPARFGSVEDARAFCQAFFHWYNNEHRHSGIAYMTPHSVHYGLADAMLVVRQATLDAAFQRHPNRFKSQNPRPLQLPDAVWINPPMQEKIEPKNTQENSLN
jgi:transposase InsO family protein